VSRQKQKEANRERNNDSLLLENAVLEKKLRHAAARFVPVDNLPMVVCKSEEEVERREKRALFNDKQTDREGPW
jgi:hypothetical protein